MWVVQGNNLSMAEDDYGIQLPIEVHGTVLTENDTIRITFKSAKNGQEILYKDYTPQENTVTLEFTAEESALFTIGTYVYSLDWYQNGLFLCNIIPCASFKVVDKA